MDGKNEAANETWFPVSSVNMDKQFQGISKKFDRMDFQRMGEKANAGRFERGCLKTTAENLTS